MKTNLTVKCVLVLGLVGMAVAQTRPLKIDYRPEAAIACLERGVSEGRIVIVDPPMSNGQISLSPLDDDDVPWVRFWLDDAAIGNSAVAMITYAIGPGESLTVGIGGVPPIVAFEYHGVLVSAVF